MTGASRARERIGSQRLVRFFSTVDRLRLPSAPMHNEEYPFIRPHLEVQRTTVTKEEEPDRK